MLVTWLALLALRLHSAASEALAELDVIATPDGSTSLEFDLIVDAYRYEGGEETLSMWTRAYNADGQGPFSTLKPGPLVRIKAGDTLIINVINNLGANNENEDTTLNTLHSPNTTNIHTHGLHVSAESPADDIFTKIEPGETFKHIYNLPADHAGGTHWYHAHNHGSTSIQAGGGLAGMLIVEDGASEVPLEVLAMPEIVMQVVHIPIEIQDMAEDAEDNLLTQDYIRTGDDFVLVNGQHRPDVTLSVGVATRFRFVFAAIESTLQLHIEGDACDWTLLAKDGVYVNDAPRVLSNGVLYFAPGNRVDAVITCTAAGTSTVVSTAVNSGTQGNANTVVDTLVNLIIVDDGSEATSIPTFTAARPVYLADLTSVNRNSMNNMEVAFSGAGDGTGACVINGEAFEYGTPIDTIETGTMQNWRVTGVAGHPFHLHVNPYQLFNVVDETGYFQAGDWHDVMLLWDGVTVGRYRFSADTFTGHQVLHCHFLEHEDLGCMGYMQIDGEEGATVSGMEATPLVCPNGCETAAPTPAPTTDCGTPGEMAGVDFSDCTETTALSVCTAVCAEGYEGDDVDYKCSATGWWWWPDGSINCEASPTLEPTPEPTSSPITLEPTPEPTLSPVTLEPTPEPTSISPTLEPTPEPTLSPSTTPSILSTTAPTPKPSTAPTTTTPSAVPSSSAIPTSSPSTAAPTASPSSAPTESESIDCGTPSEMTGVDFSDCVETTALAVCTAACAEGYDGDDVDYKCSATGWWWWPDGSIDCVAASIDYSDWFSAHSRSRVVGNSVALEFTIPADSTSTTSNRYYMSYCDASSCTDEGSFISVVSEICALSDACLGFNYYSGASDPFVLFKSSSSMSEANADSIYFYAQQDEYDTANLMTDSSQVGRRLRHNKKRTSVGILMP